MSLAAYIALYNAAVIAIGNTADTIQKWKNLFEGEGDDRRLNDRLDQLLTTVSGYGERLTQATNVIMQVLAEMQEEADFREAVRYLSQAEAALRTYVRDRQVTDAEHHTLQPAIGLKTLVAGSGDDEGKATFIPSFMQVVNIRVAALKELKPNFATQHAGELQGYISTLQSWIPKLERPVPAWHEAIVYEAEREKAIRKTGETRVVAHWWEGRHRRVVPGEGGTTEINDKFFKSPEKKPSEKLEDHTRQAIERQTNRSLLRGIGEDEQRMGVRDMRRAVAVWSQLLMSESQEGWRYCRRCGCLVFGTSGGRCPAGGASHDGSGSWNYRLRTSPAWSALTQDEWRFCRRCHVLAHALNPGDCAEGDIEHDYAGSWNYYLIHGTVRTPLKGQDNWRYCKRCSSLAHGGQPGVCQEGGAHDFSGSWNYFLLTG